MFNCHFRGFIGSSSGLLPVSKRASRPRFAPSVPRVFRIRLINERTTKIPIFHPLRVRPSTALLKVSSQPASGRHPCRTPAASGAYISVRNSLKQGASELQACSSILCLLFRIDSFQTRTTPCSKIDCKPLKT